MTSVEQIYSQALAAWNDGDHNRCAELALKALEVAPNHGPSHLLRAISLPQSQVALSAAHYISSCRNRPHDGESWFNRAVFMESLERREEAIDCYRKALIYSPTHLGALLNGTQILRIHEHFDEAIIMARRLQKIAPDNPMGYTHEAISLQLLERAEEADPIFAKAISMSSDPSHLNWEHHFSLLARERFAEAWANYECRFSPSVNNGVEDLPFDAPRWNGEHGQHVLIYGEQGLGDQLMFACAIADIVALSAKVTLAVSSPLVALYANSFPGVKVVPISFHMDRDACNAFLADAAKEQPVDSVLPIGSLMTHFRNHRNDFSGKPYLRPSLESVNFWREHDPFQNQAAGEKRKLRVGLCWASNPAPDRFFSSRRAVHKTMPVATMLPLALMEEVEAVAITNVPLGAFTDDPHIKDAIIDVSSDLTNLDRTAALLQSLDLLITVDTGVSHLAGALGVPVWVLLYAGGDARWGTRGTESSYWYGSARSFWQNELGNWDEVIERVSVALKTFADDVEASASRHLKEGEWAGE